MKGFKNKTFNSIITRHIIEDIVIKILKCCDLMVKDLKEKGEKIKNHEEIIRNSLLENYLNNNLIRNKVGITNFIFIPEVPENYINNEPKGRVDLRIMNDDYFINTDAYLIIECKRIDGERNLNRAYITNGVNRFLGKDPLYSSFYRSSGMLGFVVKSIDILDNTKKINAIHQSVNTEPSVTSHLKEYIIDKTVPYTYVSKYNNEELWIYHSFYDFSSVVSK